MMTPLCWVTGGGDQEKFTCLCPATASNISGVPSGGSTADNEKNSLQYYLSYIIRCMSTPSTKSCAESTDGLSLATVHV